MRLLLDECVDQQLRHHFQGHDCQTARYAGLAGLENGDLLGAAEAARFDALLTVDCGFEYQQNLENRKIAVIIFSGKSVLLEDLIRLIPTCLERLKSIQPGQVARIRTSAV